MPRDASGYIYAIGMEGSPYVKIGSTRGAVETRLKGLQVGQPFPLELRAFVEVSANLRKIEKMVHTSLSQEHQRGEWFETAMDEMRLTALVRDATQAIHDEDIIRNVEEPAARELACQRRALLVDQFDSTQKLLAGIAGLLPERIAKYTHGDLQVLTDRLTIFLRSALAAKSDLLLELIEGIDRKEAS